jgi:hypothetical protein
MSNPHDDPGHRPPPPRQGEPPPYQGEPQAYQGEPPPYQGEPPRYQGGPPPPPHQPPPGPPWQGPGGYGPQHPAAPPSARRPREGFTGVLFDLSFDRMITTKLIRAVYLLAILMFVVQSVLMLSIGFWVFSWRTGWAWGVFMIIGAPVMFFFETVVTRLILEFVVNQFKITEHLKAIREREGLR